MHMEPPYAKAGQTIPLPSNQKRLFYAVLCISLATNITFAAYQLNEYNEVQRQPSSQLSVKSVDTFPPFGFYMQITCGEKRAPPVAVKNFFCHVYDVNYPEISCPIHSLTATDLTSVTIVPPLQFTQGIGTEIWMGFDLDPDLCPQGGSAWLQLFQARLFANGTWVLPPPQTSRSSVTKYAPGQSVILEVGSQNYVGLSASATEDTHGNVEYNFAASVMQFRHDIDPHEMEISFRADSLTAFDINWNKQFYTMTWRDLLASLSSIFNLTVTIVTTLFPVVAIVAYRRKFVFEQWCFPVEPASPSADNFEDKHLPLVNIS